MVPVLKCGATHLLRLELEQFIVSILRQALSRLLVAVQNLVDRDVWVKQGGSGQHSPPKTSTQTSLWRLACPGLTNG